VKFGERCGGVSNLELFGLVSGIIGLLGTAFGVWTHFHSKQRRVLLWEGNYPLLLEASSADIPGLKITYFDKEIPFLNSMLITLRNTGSEPIVRDDILLPIQVSIDIEESQLLDIRLLCKDAKNNNDYTLNLEGTTAEISFKRMLPKDFIQIQFLHIAHKTPNCTLVKGPAIRDGKITVPIRYDAKRFYTLFFVLCAVFGAVALLFERFLANS